MNQQLHPNIQAANQKADLGALLLRTNHSTPQGLRGALEAFRGAADILKAHIQLGKWGAVASYEPQLPAGAALFGDDGRPAPEADLSRPPSLESADSVFTPQPPLSEEECKAVQKAKWDEREVMAEDQLFILRTRMERQGKPREEYRRIRDLFSNIPDSTAGLIWLTNEIRAGGEFIWPYHCAGCKTVLALERGKKAPKDGEKLQCHSCEWKAKEKARKAVEKAKKTEDKVHAAAKAPRAKKAAPGAKGAAPEEGGDE